MRSFNGTVLAALTLLAGCGDGAGVERVLIAAHYVPACAPLAESAPARVELVALGDFDRTNDSVSILDSDAAEASLDLPAATRAVALTTLGASVFWGTGARAASGSLDVLLWPQGDGCTLAASELEEGSAESDVALGVLQRSGQLVLAGASLAFGGSDGAPLVVDLGSGAVSASRAPEGARRSRSGATLSAWGDGLLLAGGRDVESGELLASGFLYDAETRSFAEEAIELGRARSEHAALGLPTGDSLLIGGRGADGAALASAELVFAARERRPASLSLLGEARIAPRVVPFAGGRFLVGGGHVPDGAARRAVASVEILSRDLSRPAEAPIELTPALDRAFVSLGPAGALAVGGCRLEPAAGECVACEDGRGCVSRDVWWIDGGGTAHALQPLPAELAVARPSLAAAGEGAPWLLAGTRLARFDPWLARFVPDGPTLPAASGAGQALALAPGLFVWLAQSNRTLLLSGFMHSQRAEFSQDVAPLVVSDAGRLIPHRPPRDAATDGALLRYAPGDGLELGGSEAAVSIADTTYADVSLELTLAEGPAPLIRLEGLRGTQSESETFGALDCPWPVLEASQGEVQLEVARRGDRVRLRLAGTTEETTPCVRPLPERVEIQLVGTPLGVTRVTRIDVRRTLEW